MTLSRKVENMRASVPDEPAQHELLGLQARVIAARDPGQLRLEGVIAEETRNTFLLETPRGMKRVPKAGIRLELFPDAASAAAGREGRPVEGAALVGRPEDRIKKNAPRGKDRRGGRGRRKGGGRGSGADQGSGGADGGPEGRTGDKAAGGPKNDSH
jgi:ribonuclease P protein subunit POP4